MIVVIRVPSGGVVVQAFLVPSICVALPVSQAAPTFILGFVACVRAPNAELPARYGVDAAEAVRFAVRAADAHSVFKGIRNVLQGSNVSESASAMER